MLRERKNDEKREKESIRCAPFETPSTYNSVAATRKRSLSCYIRNEDSPLKTKNGETEKKEWGEEKREGEKERRKTSCARWDSLRGLLCGASPRRCGPHATNISADEEQAGGGTEGGYSTAANVGHELRFDISNFTGAAQLMN